MEQPTKRRGGRKKQDSQAITVRLPTSLYDQLSKRAEDDGRPVAELVREALRRTYGFKVSIA